jgi:hypothetical protein
VPAHNLHPTSTVDARRLPRLRSVRRDALYLAALVGTVPVTVAEFWLVLPAAGVVAWVLRGGAIRPLWTAPLALVVLGVVSLVLFSVLGAECPRQGMDYLGECNGLGTAGVYVFYGGQIALQVAVITTVAAMLFRAGRYMRRI